MFRIHFSIILCFIYDCVKSWNYIPAKYKTFFAYFFHVVLMKQLLSFLGFTTCTWYRNKYAYLRISSHPIKTWFERINVYFFNGFGQIISFFYWYSNWKPFLTPTIFKIKIFFRESFHSKLRTLFKNFVNGTFLPWTNRHSHSDNFAHKIYLSRNLNDFETFLLK